MEFNPELVELLQSGGNIALLMSVYFIFKAAHRLARVEKMLEIIVMAIAPKAVIPPQVNGED